MQLNIKESLYKIKIAILLNNEKSGFVHRGMFFYSLLVQNHKFITHLDIIPYKIVKSIIICHL